jgi:hypothetical protein
MRRLWFVVSGSFFAAALAACGGANGVPVQPILGGGSHTSTPSATPLASPTPAGSPTSVASPTSSPTHAPTATPTPVASATPTAVPTPTPVPSPTNVPYTIFFVADAGVNAIEGFGITSNGNVPPSRVISGGSTGLSFPRRMATAPNGNIERDHGIRAGCDR